MATSGFAKLNTTLQGKTTQITAILADYLSHDMLLSWKDCIALNIIQSNFPLPTHVAANVESEASAIKNILCNEYSILRDEITSELIKTPPIKVKLKDGPIKAFKATTTRQVPLRYQNKADKHVSHLINKRVITKVSEPTDWCSHAFFVPKANGDVRLVTDFSPLNKYIERPTHPFPSTKDILQSIPSEAKVFASLDAVNGYFQIPIDEESSYLTTFLLPSGRYRYLCLPMGMSSSSDDWCRISDTVIEGYPWAKKIVDDILVHAPDYQTLHSRLRLILNRCQAINMTISKKKLQIGESIKFAGHIIEQNGIKPDPDLIKAISDFKRPNNITELRSFLGLAQQLASFVPDLAHCTNNLRKLTSIKNAYTWLDDHESDFLLTKKLLTSPLVVKAFDPSADTLLLTDASRLHGLGFALMQKSLSDSNHKLVMCGSKSLTETQQRYATVELEALAILYACQKCDFYLRGLPSFTVLTDHKPLLGHFLKPLHSIENARLLRLREKLSPYNFVVNWAPGKNHLIADTLSRAPIFEAEETELTTDSALQCLASTTTLSQLENHDDKDYKYLATAILNSNAVPKTREAAPYKKEWTRLSIDPNTKLIMLDSSRIVIPQSCKKELL